MSPISQQFTAVQCKAEFSFMTGLPILDTTTERGVHNPRVIDLISFDSEAERVVLSIVEFRDWSNSVSQIEELEEKCNNYADYVLDGHLYAQYPQYEGKRVRFEICSKSAPAGRALEFCEALSKFLSTVGIDLAVRGGFIPQFS